VTPDRELLPLELALARRDARALPAGFEAVLHEDFVEIGSSGRTWSRNEVLAALRTGAVRPRGVAIDGFAAVPLRPDTVLVTYEAVVDAEPGPGRRTSRSSIWLFLDGGWRLRFHQGTPVPDD
jgi:glyoxylase I family protein